MKVTMKVTKAMENRLAKVAMDCRDSIVAVSDSRESVSVISVINGAYYRRYNVLEFKNLKDMERRIESDCIYGK